MFANEYTGIIPQASQRLYVKWGYSSQQIQYFDEDGNEFSGTHESGYPTEYLYSEELILKGASNEAGELFVGWTSNSVLGVTGVITSIPAEYGGELKLYAVFAKGLRMANDGKIEVFSKDGLNTISEYVNGCVSAGGIDFSVADYVQVEDITFDGVELFTPIGKTGSVAFGGSYDGGEYKIYNLMIRITQAYGGMFACVKDATFKNITIESGKVLSKSGTNDYMGAIVGDADGTFKMDNCVNRATIVGSYGYCGGLIGCVGSGSFEITNCINYGNLTDDNCDVGGIVGVVGVGGGETGIIRYCANYGNISSKSRVGGIAGSARASYNSIAGDGYLYIEYCYNRGNITADTSGTYNSAGGIVGEFNTTASSTYYGRNYLRYCYSTGTITGSTKGGIVGKSYASSSGLSSQNNITNCYYLSGTASAVYGQYENKTPTVSGSSAQSASSLKGGTLTGLTDTSIWYYDGGTSYPKLQFEVGNTMPTLSVSVEQEYSQELDGEELTSSVEEDVERSLVSAELMGDGNKSSAIKVFGLSASGIFVLFTILASKKKRRKNA